MVYKVEVIFFWGFLVLFNLISFYNSISILFHRKLFLLNPSLFSLDELVPEQEQIKIKISIFFIYGISVFIKLISKLLWALPFNNYFTTHLFFYCRTIRYIIPQENNTTFAPEWSSLCYAA